MTNIDSLPGQIRLSTKLGPLQQDIKTALEEALRLLDKPGGAYRRATPTIRRMLNQAIFEQLHILDGEVVQAAPTPLVQALESAWPDPTPEKAPGSGQEPPSGDPRRTGGQKRP